MTRDRLYGKMEWQGREFILVDTGGISFRSQIQSSSKSHAGRNSHSEADVIVFVVDGRRYTAGSGYSRDTAVTNKPVLVVVNKIDNQEMEGQAWEFYSLGLSHIIPVSAIHGQNTGELLDAIVSPSHGAREEEEGRCCQGSGGR